MNIAGRMIVHNGFSGGNTRKDAFSAARETCKEMRLNKSLSNQNGNLCIRIALSDFLQKKRHSDLAEHGAGVVRGDDRNGFAALGENRKLGDIMWICQCIFDGFLRSQRWPVRRQIVFDDSLNTDFWKTGSLSCFSIWKRVCI